MTIILILATSLGHAEEKIVHRQYNGLRTQQLNSIQPAYDPTVSSWMDGQLNQQPGQYESSPGGNGAHTVTQNLSILPYHWPYSLCVLTAPSTE